MSLESYGPKLRAYLLQKKYPAILEVGGAGVQVGEVCGAGEGEVGGGGRGAVRWVGCCGAGVQRWMVHVVRWVKGCT